MNARLFMKNISGEELFVSVVVMPAYSMLKE